MIAINAPRGMRRPHAESSASEGQRAAWEARATAAEALVRNAEQQLADLERRASNAAVPREWRH